MYFPVRPAGAFGWRNKRARAWTKILYDMPMQPSQLGRWFRLHNSLLIMLRQSLSNFEPPHCSVTILFVVDVKLFFIRSKHKVYLVMISSLAHGNALSHSWTMEMLGSAMLRHIPPLRMAWHPFFQAGGVGHLTFLAGHLIRPPSSRATWTCQKLESFMASNCCVVAWKSWLYLGG